VLPRNSARSSACSQLSGVQSSVGLTGAQHGHNGSFGSSSEVELLEIMLVSVKAACGDAWCLLCVFTLWPAGALRGHGARRLH
jgi:hypothetical protein